MPNPNHQKFNRNLVNQRGASSGANKIPSNIMCNVCRGRKHQSQFAGRQLGKFNSYNKAFLRDPNSIKVTCKDCTAQQTTELTCCVCSVTKPLNGFAKSQRKNPDQARCIDCVNKDLETEPNIAPSSDESGSADFSEPDSDFDDWETPTPPTKFTPKKPSPSAAIAKPAKNEESDPDFDDNFAALTVADKKENEHEWQVAGKSKDSNASSSSTMRTKKSGWAKVAKVPTSKAARWGEDAEESNILEYPTATYGKNKGGAFNHRLVDLEDNRN
ncbi:Stc1 domain-domain-containing protein [Tuber borchii]|uniref:Stc1 domain-domain-containing protein n=1 Tax=Tuber borchii TaxID=42251 RepID=A0A2T6ZFY8_TUBBO|nr:Stc1 domain-domain-containing protein [Tuber borchii]